MEQHSQAQERQTARQEDLQREETSQRNPERETLAAAGLTARALLAGAPLWDLPPANLEELAARLGNQEMAALVERQGPAAEETAFHLPPEELETAPFSVPGLAAPAEPTAAFDPANLLG